MQLPDGYYEQAVELGSSWRQQELSGWAIVNKELRMFNEEEFYYTLTPPLLLQDTVDEFLFSTRRGFCEHYENALPQSIIDVPIRLRNSLVARDIWRQFRDTLDAVNNSWNQWVLRYDTERQLRLLNRIGLKQMGWLEMIVWLIALVFLAFTVVAYWLLRQKTYYDDKAKGLYEQFCNKLSNLGIHRFSSEGPRDFAIREINRRYDLKDEIDCITRLYIAVRYGKQLEDIDLLKHLVKEFRPASRHG